MSGPHFEAEVTYLPAEHGGRRFPAFTGYRPQFYYNGRDRDDEHEYPDVTEVPPNCPARTLLTFVSPERHDAVHPDMAFLLREGNRVVGYGVVTRRLTSASAQPDFANTESVVSDARRRELESCFSKQ